MNCHANAYDIFWSQEAGKKTFKHLSAPSTVTVIST